MESIKDYQHYNTEMEKALADKLFFLGELDDCDSFLDFGCADGALLAVVGERMPDTKLYGMDMDEAMLEKAKLRIPRAEFFCCTLPGRVEGIEYSGCAIHFSSVLHEVYSYCTEEQIGDFWQAIHDTDYQYIVIRDMICNVGSEENSCAEDVTKVRSRVEYAKQLSEFEEIWGSVDKQRNLIHFLLKYRYLYNWSREVRENYIPLTSERLLGQLDLQKYEVVRREEFILPFLQNNIKENFGIDLKDATHIKLILKRRD